MSDADSRGPQVDPVEDAYRAIVVPEWWNNATDPPRVSSLAFKVRIPFSVNLVSLMSLEDAVQHMSRKLQCPHGGIVSFNCGDARSLGFDPRKEKDLRNPDNIAHAHVYWDGSNNKRKSAAKRLAQLCQVRHQPSF